MHSDLAGPLVHQPLVCGGKWCLNLSSSCPLECTADLVGELESRLKAHKRLHLGKEMPFRRLVHYDLQ